MHSAEDQPPLQNISQGLEGLRKENLLHFRDASEFFFTLDYNFQVNLGTWDGATCYKAQGFGECRELNFGERITLIHRLCNLLFSNVDIVNSS